MVKSELTETFLDLVEFNTPHGTEAFCYPFISDIVEGNISDYIDGFGNVHVEVPGGNESVCFMSHLDNACSEFRKVSLAINNGIVSKKDKKKGVLGADDKAGAAIMIHMIRNGVPGNYVFFMGEEVGCLGSNQFLKDNQRYIGEDKIYPWTQAVSLDRYGCTEVIYDQRGGLSASFQYASAVADALGLRPSTRGVWTDSAVFTEVIPECINIAVGYKGHHTPNESQDLHFLNHIYSKIVEIDWDKLPIHRDPNAPKYRSWGTYPRLTQPTKSKPKTYDVDELDDDEWRQWCDDNLKPKTEAKADNLENLSEPGEIIQYFEEELLMKDLSDRPDLIQKVLDAYDSLQLEAAGRRNK